MKSLRKSQALAILAAGNGIHWRKSESHLSASDSDRSSTRSLFEAVLACSSCLGQDDSDDDDDEMFEQQQPRATSESKDVIPGSQNNTSFSSASKYSSSTAPSLPPLECETVHITFRRDILFASPSSWNSGQDYASKFGPWADLIPTPPARSSSRTSASYPVIRGPRRRSVAQGTMYQHIASSTSSSSLDSNFERASVLPLAISHAMSHDLSLSDIFSPIQTKIKHTDRNGRGADVLCPRSSSTLQHCVAMSLPSPPQPAFIQERNYGPEHTASSPSLKDLPMFKLGGCWQTGGDSALSSTDTLVCHDRKELIVPKGSKESFDGSEWMQVPSIRSANALQRAKTPPPAFTTSCLKIDANYSPSLTIEAVSAPVSPVVMTPPLGSPDLTHRIVRSPVTPATFNTFDTSNTPLVDRFPSIRPVEASAIASISVQHEDASDEPLELSNAKTSREAPKVVIQAMDPAFLSPNWASPSQRKAKKTDMNAGDSQLSTPRCRKGLIQTALSSSTNWLLRTAIQASDVEDEGLLQETSSHDRDFDLLNFKDALGRLQAAVSVPLTRQSFDGGALQASDSASDVSSNMAECHVSNGSSSSSQGSSKAALSDLLRELGMQPITPPLRSGAQLDAAEVAANWAARCRRSLCKAAHNSGLSPGSLFDLSAPESPQRPAGDSDAPQMETSRDDADEERTPRMLHRVEEEGEGPDDGSLSPATSFNFSICQRTPTLDDFPYTMAMLAALRRCRDSNAHDYQRQSRFSSVNPGQGPRASLATRLSESLSMPTIGLGLDDQRLQGAAEAPFASVKIGQHVGTGAGGAADSIFELYGCPPTPRIANQPHCGVTLRRTASDASMATVRSARRLSAMGGRRTSMGAGCKASRPSSALVESGSAQLWQWAEPRCPPPACPLPPLPDMPSHLSSFHRASRPLL